MALTYLAGGRTLTGVIFQPRCQQQQTEETSVSPTLKPLACVDRLIGGLSSFLTRQSSTVPVSPGVPSSSFRSPSLQGLLPATSSCDKGHHDDETERIVPTSDKNDQGQSLILRRIGLEGITQTLANDPCATSNLVNLNLSRNSLTDLPDILSNLRHLISLNVSSNLLPVIPAVLFNMSQLQILDLSENRITDIPHLLPAVLPNLVQLQLFGNLLSSLPDTISEWTQMRCLRLGSEFRGNRLTELPQTLGQMPLEELDISHNRLRHLPNSLSTLFNLVQLDVSYNLLQNLPSSVAAWQQVQTINVSNNRLTSLPYDLVTLTSMGLLNVSYNHINIFPEGLLENRQLNVMITGNPLTIPGGRCSAFSRVSQQQQQRRGSTSSTSSSSSTGSDNSYSSNEDTNVATAGVSLSNHLSVTNQSGRADDGNDDEPHDPGVNSLYELAFRQILASPSATGDADVLPDHLFQICQDGSKQVGTCVVCKGPYLREWVSGTYSKSYRGHPSVARKIRFCSRRCSQRHAEKAREVAERQSAVRMPPGPIDFSSFEWIAVAADAAAEQQAAEEDWF
ncbi:hypothetical protein BJV82DRAFT_631712 [Fennellomyces sp. T-0311]|nr:hypothetical protein BJV82DRAFT_631712 [Fennellomyces sp. T-0311]